MMFFVCSSHWQNILGISHGTGRVTYTSCEVVRDIPCSSRRDNLGANSLWGCRVLCVSVTVVSEHVQN